MGGSGRVAAAERKARVGVSLIRRSRLGMNSPFSLMDFEPAMTASVKGFSLPGIQSKKWPPFGVSTVAWRVSAYATSLRLSFI